MHVSVALRPTRSISQSINPSSPPDQSSEGMASSSTVAPVDAPSDKHMNPPLVLPPDWPIQEVPPDAWMHGDHIPNDQHMRPYRSIHFGCMPEIRLAEGTLVFGRWKGYDGQAHLFYHTNGLSSMPDGWLMAPLQWFTQLAGFYDPGHWVPRQS